MNRTSNKAFSLVEMMVVLLLMGLIAGGITLSLAAAGHNASTTDTLGRIEKLDFQLRELACLFNKPTDLIINLDTGTFRQAKTPDNPRPLPALELPSSITIQRVSLANQEVYSGEIAIHISQMGTSPSYSIWLKTKNPLPHGILFAGLTGQTTRHQDDKLSKQTFTILKDSMKNTP